MKTLKHKDKKIIEENALAFSTIDQTKKPYVVGAACCKVVENKIIITDNFMKSTVKNIKNNSNVAIVAWDKDWNGCQILGKAKYYDSGKWLNFIKSIKENKDMPAKGAIVVSINKIIKSK